MLAVKNRGVIGINTPFNVLCKGHSLYLIFYAKLGKINKYKSNLNYMGEYTESSQRQSLSTEQIRSILPYTDNRVLMDKIEYEGDGKAKAELIVRPEYFENYLKRGEKVLPLNILQDMVGQSCQLLLYLKNNFVGEAVVYHLAKQDIKFFNPINLDDKKLLLEVTHLNSFEKGSSFKIIVRALQNDGKEKMVAILNIIFVTA